MLRNNHTCRVSVLLAATAALVGALFGQNAAALPPRLQLDARMHEAGGVVTERAVVPGAVLRSGDELRVKVTPWTDGHLYVIALGSSGTATLLRPFVDGSGQNSVDKPGISLLVRAGETVSVPADGGFLPLDEQTGKEMIVAFVSAEPVDSLTRLMLRMEGLAPDLSAARGVLVEAGFEAAHISIGHDHPATAVASAPPAQAVDSAINSPTPPSPATGTPAVVQEQGVLTGLGSRIAQFTGQRSTNGSVATSPPAPVAPIAPDANPVPSQPTTTAQAPGTAAQDSSSGIGGFFGGLFGGSGESSDEAKDATLAQAESQEPTPQAARTFALPGEPVVSREPLSAVEIEQRDTAARAPAQAEVPPPSALTHDPNADAKAVASTGRMVAPLPVESTLYAPGQVPPSQAAPALAAAGDESAPALPPDSAVQRTVSRIFAGERTTPEPTATDPAVTAAPQAPAPAPASPIVAVAPKELEPPPSTLARVEVEQDTTTRASGPLAATSPAETAPVAPEQAAVSQAAASNEPEAATPADSQSSGWFSGLASLFSADESSTPAAQSATAGEASVEPDPPTAASAAVEADRAPASAVPPNNNEAAVLSAAGTRLPPVTALERERGVVVDTPTTSSVAVQAAAPSAPAPEGTDRSEVAVAPEPQAVSGDEATSVASTSVGTGDSVQGDAIQDAQGDSRGDPQGETGSGSTEADSGLFAGLGRFFSGGETTQESEQQVQTSTSADAEAAQQQEPPATAVVVAPQPAPVQPSVPAVAPSEASQEDAANESSSSGGFLAGLGALFGGSSSSDESPSPSAGDSAAVGPVQDKAPVARVNTGNEPSIERRVDAEGREVVRLQGGAAPAAGSRIAQEQGVLSGAGSRIRALLDEPEPEPEPQPVQQAARAVAESGASQSAALAAVATPQPAPQPVPTPAPAVEVETAPQAAASRAVVAAPPPPSPASNTVIAPDPVQSALASGEAPVQQVVPQLALLSAAPARTIATATEALAVVDLTAAGGPAAAVVLVVTPHGSTSGVLVDRTGHILTNWHSVRRQDRVVVMFKQAGTTDPQPSSRQFARVVGHSKFANLALLKVDAVPPGAVPPLIVESVEVESGEPLHAIGHVGGRDGNAQWRHAIATLDRVRRGSSWYSTQRVLHRADVVRAQMDPVQDITGAPLFNNRLELIGLGAMVRADKGEIIGVSAATIRRFLAGAG